MALSFSGRTIGDITILKCDGRIVEGAESVALRQRVNEVLEITPAIVLDLEGVHAIDSGGLGMLVRILSRAGHGHLKLCRMNRRISETLKITRLSTIFDCHESEADAIAAFYRLAVPSLDESLLFAPRILCVGKAAEMLTYMREVLRQAGLSVTTIDNLPDAVTLLKATTPKIVLVDRELRGAGSAGTVDMFNRLIETLPVVELPADFARRDPIETAPELVGRVRALLAGAT